MSDGNCEERRDERAQQKRRSVNTNGDHWNVQVDQETDSSDQRDHGVDSGETEDGAKRSGSQRAIRRPRRAFSVARAQAGRYYCRGDNGFSSEGALAGLTLVVEHAPEVGEEVVVSVVAGEEVELVCGARGEPRPEGRWSREGEEVEGTGDRLTVKLPEVKQVEEVELF